MNDTQNEPRSSKARSPEQARAAALARWGKPKVAATQPAAQPSALPQLIDDADLLSTPEPPAPEHTGVRRIGRYTVSDQCAATILKNIWAYDCYALAHTHHA